MNDRTPIDAISIACLGALGALSLVYVGWTTVDSWMRRAGRAV